MKPIDGAFLGTVLILGGYLLGRGLEVLGLLPQIGYVLAGASLGFAIGAPLVARIFAPLVGFLLFYLGYVASERRLTAAPFQLILVQPARTIVGTAIFFPFFFLLTGHVGTSFALAVLMSTSSALVLKWGKNTSYGRVEQSILAMDALITAIAIVALTEGGNPLAIAVLVGVYALMILAPNPTANIITLIALYAAAELTKTWDLLAWPFVFLLGVFIHHAVSRHHTIDEVAMEILPALVLLGIGASIALSDAATPLWAIILMILSGIQNFITLVILGPALAISPKSGAHIAIRTLGPSEGAVFAAAILGLPQMAAAIALFYVVALFVESGAKTEKDADKLMSMVLGGLWKKIEALELEYLPIMVRKHILFSEAYVKHVRSRLMALIVSLLVAIAAGYLLAYAIIEAPVMYRTAIIFLGVTAGVLALLKMISTYFDVVRISLEFISHHGYRGKLRFGKSPELFVGGYLAMLIGFMLLTVGTPVLNLIVMFLAMLLISVGLLLMLHNYAKIYRELHRKKDYALSVSRAS